MSPHPRLYLVLDQGGHASRAALFDDGGKQVALASVEIATHHLAPDVVEHDPEEMVSSLQDAIAKVVTKAGDAPIIAAGLAVQRSSVVCWDRHDGSPLSPIISWQDRRNSKWLGGLQSQASDIKRRTGLPLSPHYGASKLRWCWDHLPAVRQAMQDGRLVWGPLASFLIYRLTVKHNLYVDPANASRTLLWNLDSGDWDGDLLQLFGIPAGALPPCVPSRHVFGDITCDERCIPLTLVTGDQSAALFAATEPVIGRVMINLGTGAFLQQAWSQRPPSTSLLTSLAYEDANRRIYALEGTVNGAGSALSWLAVQSNTPLEEITQRLPQWLKECRDPPLFLNGISGLGTPYLRPHFASHFIGEGPLEEQCVAVIESIVFLLQVNVEEMRRAGSKINGITISGGLSRLDGLCQRLADLSGTTLIRPANHESTLLGVLHLMSDAELGDLPPATCFQPNINDALTERFQRWRREMNAAMI